MRCQELYDQVCAIAEAAGFLWQRGWAERNGGNISVCVTDSINIATFGDRVPLKKVNIPVMEPLKAIEGEYYYVTGTNRRMRDVAVNPMGNGAIIRICADGKSFDIMADEVIMPTSEIVSHLAIHNFEQSHGRSRIKAVCHTHPTNLVALSHKEEFLKDGVLSRMLWSMIPETRIIVPHGIGIVPYCQPGTVALAHATIKQLVEHDIVLWEKHGCLAVGEDILEAFDLIDTLDKSADIYLDCCKAGFRPQGISDEMLDGLVDLFGLK
ncbi:MAG: rhamnulose-1-phosphate aldolase [Bacteroidales bacterium]|nr:rhamnulose-1-phosphate aldolase [Bacteroidales bacterium]